MLKWIAGSTCCAAVLSLAVASAQTYPQTSDKQPATKPAPSSRTGSAASARPAAQQVTMTGCLMRGSGAQSSTWVLSNATKTDNTLTASASASDRGTTDESRAGTSRAGSPSNEGTSVGNRNGAAGIGVSGSTTAAIGTSGATNPSTVIDTEVNGGGTLGATDRKGSTVGAGATAGATATAARGGETATSSTGGASYQLMGVRNPTQYMNKRVEVIGTASASGTHMLRATSVRLLGDTCR